MEYEGKVENVVKKGEEHLWEAGKKVKGKYKVADLARDMVN